MTSPTPIASCTLAVLAALVIAAPVGAATLPAVGSGTLVAQFKADASDLVLDGTGGDNVASWAAANDGSIVLTRTGTTPADDDNIEFDASENGGKGAIVVNDFTGDNIVLKGAIAGTRTASTVFFYGYFDPGRDGSLGDGSGQYIYSYGADGVDGSQLDLQIDDNNAEIYSGGGTQIAGDISADNGLYTVYRVEYGGGGGADWALYADGSLVGSGTNAGNYSVSGDLILFGYQNGAGDSGGFNFVGNVTELLIYDGILNSTDAAAIEAYLVFVPAPAALPAGLAMIVALAARRRRCA